MDFSKYTHTLKDQEYLQRNCYYNSTDFRNQLIILMIPDVAQYVSNIFYCLHCAELSRKIIQDIIQNITKRKQGHGQFVNSKDYKIGGLSVDAREFAQRNIREWCEYISKINDGLAQVINIVLEFGLDVKKVSPISIQNRLSANHFIGLKKHYENFVQTTTFPRMLNNFSKHTLNIWGCENLNADKIKSASYFILWENEKVSIMDKITSAYEWEVTKRTIDILDTVFEVANINAHENRIYVPITKYEEARGVIHHGGLVEPCGDRLLGLVMLTETVDESATKKYIWRHDSDPKPEIFIATYYRDNSRCFTAIGVPAYESFDVYKQGSYVGRYMRDLSTANVPYLRFEKYNYIPQEHKAQNP